MAFGASQPALMPSCPPVLHIRQLLSFPRISAQQRHDLQLHLKGYLEELRQKKKWKKEVQPLDIQTVGKQVSSTGGHRIYLYTSNSKSRDQDFEETEISQRYMLAVQKTPPTPARQRNIAETVEEISGTEREKREKRRLLWSDKIERCRKEEQEARECLRDLARKAIPPYFSSQQGKVIHVNQIPELEALTKPHLDKKEASLLEEGNIPCIPTITPRNQDSRKTSPPDHIEDPEPQDGPPSSTMKPNILPTKAVPWDRSGLRDSSTQTKCKSLFFDLLGNPRKNRVPLPLSMVLPRPCCIPNPRVLNDSLDTNPFLFVPARVTFGEVRRGEPRSRNVTLHNLSLQKHRYKVKQPAEETGLRVLYRPGIISPGMRTVLCVELQAVTHGKVVYDIEIQMDTHTLFLPVSANILYLEREKFFNNQRQQPIREANFV
uniref:sperm-associated antigen 17-like n=1 Tax=Myxine glutinosa TaxID=7769 RepID=UPI00358EBD45